MTSAIACRYSILSRSCIVTHKWAWGAFQLIKYLTFIQKSFDFWHISISQCEEIWYLLSPYLLEFCFFYSLYVTYLYEFILWYSLICNLQGYCWGNVWSCVWILHGKYFMNNLFNLDNNIRFIDYRIFFRNMTCKSFCLEICLSCWWADAPKL